MKKGADKIWASKVPNGGSCKGKLLACAAAGRGDTNGVGLEKRKLGERSRELKHAALAIITFQPIPV